MAAKRTKSGRTSTPPVARIGGKADATPKTVRSGGLNLWVGAGIGAGVGSAAIAAALLYANSQKKAVPPGGPKDDDEA